MRTVLTWLTVLVVLGAAGAGGWWYYRKQTTVPPSYRFGEAKRGDVVQAIAATGTIVPEDTIDVGAQVNGQIASFGLGVDGKPVDYRSEVEEGAVLAKIDEALYAADVATVEAQLASAEAQVRLATANRDQARASLLRAEQDWTRAQKLAGTQAISQAELDAMRAAHDAAVANVAVSEAQIGQAQASVAISNASLVRARRNLGYCVITSPVSGVIIDKRVDVGQTVVASLNAPSLFLIAKDLRRMLVLVQVNEADIANVEPGRPVTFTVDGVPGRDFAGEVRKIRLNAAMTQNVVTYTVEIVTNNADLKLLPYLTANVRFILEKHEGVLTVPNTALRFTPRSTGETSASSSGAANGMGGGGGMAGGPGGAGRGNGSRGDRGGKKGESTGTVWVLGPDGQPRSVSVTLGLSDGSVTEVMGEGLSEGLQVIVGEQSSQSSRPSTGASPFAPRMRR